MQRLLVAICALTVALVPQPAATQQNEGGRRFDVLIRNGRVMDGSGNPWLRADVGITGDRIAAVGRLTDAAAATVIDARDRVVSPGFIDVHSHAADGLRTAALHQAQP